jgi:ABC-type nickel/cobalt efflux system permease component RcnA
MNRKTFIIILLLLSVSFLYAQDNPFVSKDDSKADQEQSVKRIHYPKFFQRFVSVIASIQHSLNNRLSQLTRTIKEKKDARSLLVLIGISMLYGIIHALGPGHGKIIMVSYALANPLKLKNGILLGVSIAFLHAISAIVFVSVVYLILKMSYFSSFGSQKRLISLVSYGLVSLLGVFLLTRALIRINKRRNAENGYSNHVKKAGNTKAFELLTVALLIGLVPCEGALFVLIFSISMDIYHVGILLVLVIGFGMAITIGATGVIAIGLRKSLLVVSSRRRNLAYLLESIFEVGGGALVLILGSMLFLANF